jgi:hypothetical protein
MSSTQSGQPLPPDKNIGPVLVWLTLSLALVAWGLTGLRLLVRWRSRNLGWDDYTMILANLAANSRMIFQFLQLRHGNGRHRVYLDPEQYVLSSKWGWYAQMGLFGGMCFVKISICLLILRLKNNKFLRWLLGVCITGLVITNSAFIIILLAECRPINAYWRPSRGKCWPSAVRIYTAYCAVGTLRHAHIYSYNC